MYTVAFKDSKLVAFNADLVFSDIDDLIGTEIDTIGEDGSRSKSEPDVVLVQRVKHPNTFSHFGDNLNPRMIVVAGKFSLVKDLVIQMAGTAWAGTIDTSCIPEGEVVRVIVTTMGSRLFQYDLSNWEVERVMPCESGQTRIIYSDFSVMTKEGVKLHPVFLAQQDPTEEDLIQLAAMHAERHVIPRGRKATTYDLDRVAPTWTCTSNLRLGISVRYHEGEVLLMKFGRDPNVTDYAKRTLTTRQRLTQWIDEWANADNKPAGVVASIPLADAAEEEQVVGRIPVNQAEEEPATPAFTPAE